MAPPSIENINAAWYNQECKTTPSPKGYLTLENISANAPDEFVNADLNHALQYCDAAQQCVGIEYDKEQNLYKTKHSYNGVQDERSTFLRKT